LTCNMMRISKVVVGASLLSVVNAECPNACSSHGVCTNYDMCQCYRNWMANDCSERVCQFGLAHVDTPKGDLDASSGVLTGPAETVIANSEVYPYGTSEQFPNMVNSEGAVLTETAHYYMECSNKGLCDRESGTCECFPGYEGSACQRASCPMGGGDGEGAGAVCSGHGTCNSIKEIAGDDYNNIYELWDEHSTLGCVCDAGYYGADCSLRRCKWGADPLYLDDSTATPRVANWTYGFYVDNSGLASTLSGNYSIVFYDVHGEDWRTEAIAHDDGCDAIIDKIEAIPNDVVPDNSVLCYDYVSSEFDDVIDPDADANYDSGNNKHYFKIATLVFPENVGKLRQIDIDTHLDGPRPTLVTNEATSTLRSFVFANGYHGEYVDYVSDHCEGVLATIAINAISPYVHSLDGLDHQETILLKRCLADADGDSSPSGQEDEVYNWDFGTFQNPHLIKLVENSATPYSRICNATTTYFAPMGNSDWCDNYSPAGIYAPLLWDDAAKHFKIFTQVPRTVYAADTEFRVFTTTGRLEKISEDSNLIHDSEMFSKKVFYQSSTGTSDAIDCETRTRTDETTCLQKGDIVMFFNPTASLNNPWYHNMYTVEKISTSRDGPYSAGKKIIDGSNTDAITEIVLNMGNNLNHLNTLFAYKFIAPTGVSWAAECSDRGVCDTGSGVCQCFTGYTSDDCSMQNTLAK